MLFPIPTVINRCTIVAAACSYRRCSWVYAYMRVDNSCALMLHAFNRGITHFDLANNYDPPSGSAEANFGRILREDFHGLRDDLVISTKDGYTMWDGP